jgi:hypothetical protein
MPGRLLRFDLDAVTTSLRAPSYMEESYVKGIIEEKQARSPLISQQIKPLAPPAACLPCWVVAGRLNGCAACKPRPRSWQLCL